MSIYVIGDTHACWTGLNNLIKDKKPEIVLQTGDFGFWPRHQHIYKIGKLRARDTKIYFADGNHEDFSELNKLKVKEGPIQIKKDSVYWMPRGTTLTLPDGRVVLFMGGADSIDKDNRILGESWFPEELISTSDVNSLDENMKIDIVISHTCPLEFKGFERFNSPMVDPSRHALSYVLNTFKPDLWFFSHFHFFAEGYNNHNNCQWMCLNMDGHAGFSINLDEV